MLRQTFVTRAKIIIWVTSSQVQELVETNKALREMVIIVAGLLKDSGSISSFLGRRDYGLFWTG